MPETRENQSAYPYFWDFGQGMTDASEGLTKKEYFAAQAMKGILANGDYNKTRDKKTTGEKAVRHANELIDALNQEQ